MRQHADAHDHDARGGDLAGHSAPGKRTRTQSLQLKRDPSTAPPELAHAPEGGDADPFDFSFGDTPDLTGCDTSRPHEEYDYEPTQYDARGNVTQWRMFTRYYHVPAGVMGANDKSNTTENRGRGELISNILYKARKSSGHLWWQYRAGEPAEYAPPIHIPGDGSTHRTITLPTYKGAVSITYNTITDADTIRVTTTDGKPVFSTGGMIATEPVGATPGSGNLTTGSLPFDTRDGKLVLDVSASKVDSLWDVTLSFPSTIEAYSSDDRYGPIDADHRDIR